MLNKMLLGLALSVQRLLNLCDRMDRLTSCSYPYHYLYTSPSSLPNSKKLRCPTCNRFAK